MKDALIFKGGTCIKKVHIEDYRFSEDIDFTLNPAKEQTISNDEIYNAFGEVFVKIKEAGTYSSFLTKKWEYVFYVLKK